MVLPAQVTPTAWTPEMVEAMRPSVEASPWGGLAVPHEALHGSHLFTFTDGGQRALVALRPVVFGRGTRLDVVGLVSQGDRLHGAQFDEALLGTARCFGASVLAMTTAREHIERQCLRQGWERTGSVMTKAIHV